jgi:tyrosinase
VINFLISYMATVGPGAPVMNNVPKNPMASGGGYNPRCMRRDVNSEVALGATADKSYNLITLSKDINTFYNTLLTPPVNRSDPYNWGIHNSGHYISGGDPGGDPMVSPGDPIFYFHHAMLDRLWWIWQMQDPDTRVNAQVTLGGTSTNRQIDLKWLIGDVIPVLEAHDGLGGHGGAFCHVYV